MEHYFKPLLLKPEEIPSDGVFRNRHLFVDYKSVQKDRLERKKIAGIALLDKHCTLPKLQGNDRYLLKVKKVILDKNNNLVPIYTLGEIKHFCSFEKHVEPRCENNVHKFFYQEECRQCHEVVIANEWPAVIEIGQTCPHCGEVAQNFLPQLIQSLGIAESFTQQYKIYQSYKEELLQKTKEFLLKAYPPVAVNVREFREVFECNCKMETFEYYDEDSAFAHGVSYEVEHIWYVYDRIAENWVGLPKVWPTTREQAEQFNSRFCQTEPEANLKKVCEFLERLFGKPLPKQAEIDEIQKAIDEIHERKNQARLELEQTIKPVKDTLIAELDSNWLYIPALVSFASMDFKPGYARFLNLVELIANYGGIQEQLTELTAQKSKKHRKLEIEL